MDNFTNKITIILVSVGTFQNYILDNIKQLLHFKYNITVITDKKFFHYLNNINTINIIDSNILLTSFDNNSKLCKSFRNGFWHNSSKRLFLIYEYMKQYNITNCIHLENDVLLYYDFNNYKFDKNKIYLTIDAPTRCIPGIIYIPHFKLLDNLINNYNYSKNDMYNMNLFYNNNKNICITFPIIKNNKHYNKTDIYNHNFNLFNGIFDAAAIGQYLGGVDPRNIPGNSIGFINETCVVKYNNYEFKWITYNNGYKIPYIIIDNDEIPILNLHIHSKNLSKFMIDN